MSCDCAHPAVYSAKVVRVRKQHKCTECNHRINIGESAEKVDALWDDQFQTVYTCVECCKIRDFLKEKFPEDICCHGELFDFIWEAGFLFSEDEIEEEADWVQDYNDSVGVVRGSNCIIATHVPWLIRRNGKFCLAAGWGEKC